MVTLPKDFVAIKYPGYFWHLKEERLYSMKMTGVLRPLAKPQPPNFWNHGVSLYKLSVNGNHKYVGLDYLKKLKAANSTIPMEQK